MAELSRSDDLKPLFADHPRNWHENHYVYPVISRRSGGLSVGVNLNPDKACNFDCVYCQVDRTIAPVVRKVDPDRLRVELGQMLRLAANGALFDDPAFAQVPPPYRRINDIAFSGDGEPTTSPCLLDAVRIAADLKRELGLGEVKLVLITDSAYLTQPQVREALAVMDANNGELWTKLDAGTEAYYQQVNRPNVELQRVLDNILDAARVRPVVIQSLWMALHGQPPPDAEIDAFADRLRTIITQGGMIKLVQVYTVARQTAEPWVTPLPDAMVESIAARIRAIVDLPVSIFGS